MKNFVIILSLMTLLMSPCWSQSTTNLSDVSPQVKQLLTDSIRELLTLRELLPKLQESLRIAEEKLLSSSQSENAGESSTKRLEELLQKATKRVLELETQVTELLLDSGKLSISLEELRVEIQLQKDEHTNEIKLIIVEYDKKIQNRNTVIIVESVVILILGVVVTLFAISN